MGSKIVVLSSLLVLTLTTACQQSASPDGSAAEQANAALSDGDATCADLAPADSALTLKGAAAAEVGQKVTYKLNKKVCTGSEKIGWKMGDASEVQTTGAVMTSTYSAPGSYIVSASLESAEATQTTLVIGKAPALTGPQVIGINTPSTFKLVLPKGFTLASTTWNFGDNSANVSGGFSVSHAWAQIGLYELKVAVKDTNNTLYNLSQSINVLADSAQLDCAGQAGISAATEANINTPVSITGYIPPCLQGDLTGFSFSFGDGSSSNQLSNSHTYTVGGLYNVHLDINTFFQDDSSRPYIRLSHTIQVIDPNQNCLTAGETRTSYTDSFTQTAACGRDGSKTDTYKTKIVEECKLNQGSLMWTETSRTNELVSGGTCQGQSCLLPDNSVLPNGGSKVFYLSGAPTGLCADQSLTRVCNNGVLSGSDTYTNLTCHNGCGDFGAHGTVKLAVITGEIKTELKCSFNETGLFSIYNQTSDQKCVDGQVVSSNTQQGSLKSTDVCPTYHWAATETWSTCSADCGGQQSRTFACLDDKNQPAAEERCTAARPTETRVCDGNPAAVARVERTSVEESGGSSAVCPKNQIGVITQTRTATTVKSYACIDHSVQLSEQHVEYTPWVTESYCRDYTAYRCSQDSLSNTQAVGRYKWLLKCQSSVPIIKEFLEQFASIKGSGVYKIDSKSRVLYPTFMERTTAGKEKVWIAPTVETASCNVPATAYIAAVCVSSCATPDQQILVEDSINNKKEMKYMSFVEALTKNMKAVGTLSPDSTMNTKIAQATQVDQWVTELFDTEHLILEFRMKSGRSLRVTPNHPIVADDGSVKSAESFKAGENLVQLGGQFDQITSISETKYFGKVYNVFVKSSAPLHNIVVTNGYLNGTAFYQNEGSDNLNKVLLRQRLIKGAFSK